MAIMLKPLIGGLLGGGLGFIFWRFVGCTTGACPLEKNPYLAVLYGMVLGVFIAYGTGSK